MQRSQRIFKEKLLLALFAKIIDNFPAQKSMSYGLPIGNLTSQHFSNLYLTKIDHWICNQKGQTAYIRYVDDLIIFGNNKNKLWFLRDELINQLNELGLELHPKKQQLMRTSEKVDVLGYKISPRKRWLRNDNGYRFRRKLKIFSIKYQDNKVQIGAIRKSVYSWLGHSKHGETNGLVRAIFKKISFNKKS